jgi:hypothetical protein
VIARGLAVVFFCIGLAATGAAQPIALEWSAPPECPDREWVIAEVQRLVSAEVLDREFAAQAVMTAEAGRYHIAITTSSADGHGERSLSASSCERLAETAAVVIALAVDAAAFTREQVVPDDGVEALLGVSLLGEAGSLPKVTGALALRGGIAFVGAVTGRLEAWASTSTSQDVPAQTGVPGGASVRMIFAGGVRGCLLGSWAPIEVGGCAGIELGALQASAFGISDPGSTIAPWLGIPLGALFTLRATEWLGVLVGIDLVLAPLAPRFVIDLVSGDGTSERMIVASGAASARAMVGAELRL